MACGLETSLVAKMTKLKLSYFRHIMRKSGYFGKDNYVGGKWKAAEKRGRPNTRWADFMKEGIDTIYGS